MSHNNNQPQYLYHGSRFEQTELKPGFYHSGKLVTWDGTENNKHLYATTDESLAVELGFASSIEKQFPIDRFHVDKKKIKIQTKQPLTVQQLEQVPVFVYTIELLPQEGWVKNNNKHNGIDSEWKTPETVKAIVHCRAVNVREWLKHYQIDIQRVMPSVGEGSSKEAMESATPAYIGW
jgi:hypothetical protein